MALKGCLVHSFLVLLLSVAVNSEEVQGCGGYVKSDVEINFAQVGIKLYTAQGSLKYETECAPNDGYYFMPVYDKGQYVIKVAPPPGWSVEPSEVEVTMDGQSDPCSRKEDINFHFKGFAVIGKVSSGGGGSGGPAGVQVALHKGSNLVLTTESGQDGQFVFTPLAAGSYSVSVAHPTWSFISDSTTVSISDQNGEVAGGALVVRGYRVQGTVLGERSERGAAGVTVVLHSDNQAVNKHYSSYPPGCKAGLPSGYSASPSLGAAVCHTLTDGKGRYTFTNLVPGQYRLAAHHHTPFTTYVMAPEHVAVTVGHADTAVEQNFRLEGFSVKGRVLSGGAGVAGATVTIAKTGQSVTTAADGSYTLHNVKAARHTITVTADALQFEPLVVSLSAAEPSVVDVSPSRFRSCFRVVLDKAGQRPDQRHNTWTVAVSGTSGEQKVSTDASGRGCAMLAAGDYRVTVQLTEQQQNSGVRFGPAEHRVSVRERVPEEVVFSQFLGEVRAAVTCLQACPAAVALTLRSGHGQDRTATATGAKDSKKVTTTWKEVVPGKYEVLVQKDDWCWTQKSVSTEVNTENVAVELVQSGYLLTVTSSHAATLSYTVQDKKGVVEVQKGTTKICLTTPGVYTFTPESCHRFSASSYKWNTAEPTLLSLAATHHSISATIRSSQPGAFQLQVKREDGTTTLLQPRKDAAVNHYTFEHMVKERDEIVLMPLSSDNLFQYQPTSHSMTVATDCMADVVTFTAEKALFIDGQVRPAVAGVEIIVEAGDQKHVFTTGADGRYKAGPLDNSLKYSISASLVGYTITALDDEGNFEAFKLAEVIVEIVDEDKKPLSGVVVSMSGGKSYRQNSLTGEDGRLTFNSLLPGEYFLRAAMKEYNFQPPNKMVNLEQGATINIDIKGIRVAYSAMGTTASLTGVLEPDVAVEARGVGPNCQQYQEEAVTDQSGAFRIRGLLPKCEYDIGLKFGEGLNKQIERMLPATTRVKVAEEDLIGLRLVVLRYFNQMDVVGTVESPKEHLSSLSVKVYRDDVADSAVHTIKMTDHPFFILPPMMADGKTYTLQLESTLSTMQYSYRNIEVSFVADSSFKHVKLNFRPTMRSLDAEMNHNTMAGLLLAILIICCVVNYERIAPAIEWAIDVIGNMINKNMGAPGVGGASLDAAKRAKSRRMS